MKYEVVGTNDNFNDLVGIVGNLIIHLSGYVSEKKYTEGLRLAKIFDAEEEDAISFLTNIFELGPLVIANIYPNRWQIEASIKWIEGPLTIKVFWGYSKDVVNNHLWGAISSSLLLVWVKSRSQEPVDLHGSLKKR